MKSQQWIQIIFILSCTVLAEALTKGDSLISPEEPSEYSRETTYSDNDVNHNEDNIVITNSGRVLGHIRSDTPAIRRFYDIPYGTFSDFNSFEEPSPTKPWEKVHDEKEHKSRCPQIIYPDVYIGSTECLTLSIMTPTTSAGADVLFHIHGNDFNTGSGDPSIYGPEYLVPKGIILVLPNYRLGALGFLCSQNATIPGNTALKDLTLALKWIKDNIAAFGGNPHNIVVSGVGTAGALAGYLAISPVSRDYVSKVIAESGFVLSHWAIDRYPLATLETLLQKIDTSIETITSMSNYTYMLTKFHTEILIAAARDMTFAPCVETGENSFMTETPWSMLHGLKTNITYMIGSTSHAGIREALQTIKSNLSDINNDFGIIMPNDLDFKNDDDKRSRIVNKIRAQYFGDQKVTEEDVEILSFCYTDCSYLGPTVRAARSLVAASARVYFYEFSFGGSLNQEIAHPIKLHGATRGDMARYVFCHNGSIPNEDARERQMIDVLTQLWASFIHTGKPIADNVEWPCLEETTELNENWLFIGSEVKPQKGLHVDRLNLWTEIYDTYFVEHNRAYGLSPYIYSLIFTLFLFVCLSKILV